MRRLVVITDAWHPQVNGVVSCYDRMNERLGVRGWEMKVIHPGLFRTVSLPGYPEIRLAIFAKRKMRRLLREMRPDAVHIAVEGPLGLAARSICRSRKIPFTTCYHTHFQMYLEARGLRFFVGAAYAYLRWFHNSGVRTMVATPSLREELASHGFKNLALWPLGVDISAFKKDSAPIAQGLPKPIFAYFGRVSVEKSVEEFLQLDLEGTKLVIGDGPDRKRLEGTYAKEAKFLGYKSGQELADWLSACDVMVFPSRTETFGLVIVEALACGVPVAAHDVMGPRDIISSGVDGYLSEDLGDAAMKCLSLDRAACRKKAESYSWGASADAFVANLQLRGDRRESNPD